MYPEFRISERFLERTTVPWKSYLFYNVFINLIKRLHREASNLLLMDEKLLISHHFCHPDSHTLSPLSARAAVHAAAASEQPVGASHHFLLPCWWKPDQCDDVYPLQRSTISALLSVNSL